jgi:hypothetical protein
LKEADVVLEEVKAKSRLLRSCIPRLMKRRIIKSSKFKRLCVSKHV